MAAFCAGGCGVGAGAAGMSGDQVVRGHDVADLFFANPTTLAFTRKAADPASVEPQDLWVWGLADEAPVLALPGIDWAAPEEWTRTRIGDLLQTGPTQRLFYDFGRRQGADLGGLAVPGTSPISYPNVVAVRRDGGGIAVTGAEIGRLGVGPPTDLQMFTLDGSVGGMDFIGSDVALLYLPNSHLDPAVGIAPSLVGVYRLGVPSGELTALVPATEEISMWTGTVSTCNAGFGASPCALFKVIGCQSTDAACPETGVAPCAIVYVKSDPDKPGETAAYAYDVNAGGGFKLPGQGASHLYVSPDQHLLLWDDDVIISRRYWNLCTGKKDFCPDVDGSHVLWRPDSNGFVTINNFGGLAVATFTNNLCAGNPMGLLSVANAFYSPSGDRLAWVGADPNAQPAPGLWLANADGSSAAKVASGAITVGRFSPNGQRMLIGRANGSSTSLGWLDLTVNPPVEHFLADNYGGFSRGGDRRVLLIDHWNTQDTSGDLVLIDMLGGARHELGRAVTEFAISGGQANTGVDVAGTSVAYAVRSRVASDRDGLWMTALPP